MGLSALGTAIGYALVSDSPHARILSRMFYPLGFIIVIIGRSQLFTENTLYPVALVLKEKRQFWNTMRLWAIVLPTNVLGAFAFAMLATRTSARSTSNALPCRECSHDRLRSEPGREKSSRIVTWWPAER